MKIWPKKIPPQKKKKKRTKIKPQTTWNSYWPKLGIVWLLNLKISFCIPDAFQKRCGPVLAARYFLHKYVVVLHYGLLKPSGSVVLKLLKASDCGGCAEALRTRECLGFPTQIAHSQFNCYKTWRQNKIFIFIQEKIKVLGKWQDILKEEQK